MKTESNITNKDVIVGGICIINKAHRRAKQIISKSDFFNDELIVKVEENKITFTKAYITHEGKSQKASLDKKGGYYHLSVVCELPNGKYEFDTNESNEDCMVAYCG